VHRTPDAVEVTLDAEWATGMAPGANLRIYATPSLLDSDLIAACAQILNYAATDATLREVSYSASGPEDQAASGTLHGYSQTFAQLAAAGITFFCSSGDGGSNPDPTVSGPNGYSALYPLTVEYPASDPNVTGVGGTTVAFDSNYNAILSSAWTPGFAGTLGTGGGYSTAFTRPSWQSGAGVPGGTARCVPDVAAVAQGSMGGVGFGALLILNGQDSGRVGTSLSSPVWAGIGAAINQDRTSHGLAPVGLLGPWVYSLIGSIGFTDIISGNNGAYAAGIGYDLCTGIGSPNVANLVALIDEEITSVGPPASPVNPGTLVTMSATPQLPSTYQWQLNGVKISGATGVALAELYDADTGTPSSHLINISARAYVGTGSQVLVAGFVITGTTPETVLIRGVGPTEAQYGVAGSLAAPQLALYDSSGAIIATNAGWGNGPVAGPSTVSAGLQPATSAVFSSVYAFGLASGSADCAMVVTLPPGSYTAQVSGVGSTTGIALIEVYNLP
jgi:subtilase family serine protease